MSSFEAVLAETFPGALPSSVFLDRVRASVDTLGFTVEHTLPLISVCRDELTSRFAGAIESEWGLAFTLAGLGGVPALGRTGWNAALSHIPDDGGRGAVIVFGFPHIGIESDGAIGVTLRQNQIEPTPTCGALAAIFDMVGRHALPTEVDVDDYEATRLALRLVDPLHPPRSLAELTISSLDALEVDLWKAIDGVRLWESHDVAVFCGVQVHGRDDDWIWPRDAWYTLADGHRRRFPTDGDE